MSFIKKYRKLLVLLFVISFVIGCLFEYYRTTSRFIPVIEREVDEYKIYEIINTIFHIRNNAILKQDKESLKKLYNKNVRNGLWAYEHELKKMKYLDNWSKKQGVNWIEKKSDIIIRRANKKNGGYSLNLLVSTEYKYKYTNSKDTINTFRIGTYHSLDLIPDNGNYLITREWYTDPFADSLDLNRLKGQNLKDIIISQKPESFSDLPPKRIKVVEYADKYCGAASLPQYDYTYNPDYTNYNHLGGDCANFASQILYEAGGFSKTSTWNYKNDKGSKAWINAHSFNNFILYSGRGTKIDRGKYEDVLKSSYKLLPGDYIAYERNSEIVHISIVTGVDSRGYVLVNSHNADRYRVPWDLGWSNEQIIFWLVRIHYP